MSGFGLIFSQQSGSVPPDSVQRIKQALFVHGPTSQNTESFACGALCSAKGQSISLEDMYDRQPVVHARFALVLSGRLNHRSTTGERLGKSSSQLGRISDSALALLAWERWGLDCTAHLFGPYCLAVLDRKDRILHLVRSSIGGPAIYYHEASALFYAATAPKAIHAASGLDRTLDETKLADVLVRNFDDVSRSLYKGISTLPLGQCIQVSEQGRKIGTIISNITPRPLKLKSDAAYVDAAWETFDRAIAGSLRGVTRPALTLSAGLDSSSVSVAVLEHLRRNNQPTTVSTYTHVPAKGWDGRVRGGKRIGDESGPVKAMGEMYPELDQAFIDSEGIPLDTDLEKIFLMSEMPPFAAINSYWVLDIYRAAAARGQKVILTGAGGNGTLSYGGRALLADLLRQGKLATLSKALANQSDNDAFLNGLYSRAIAANLPKPIARRIATWRGIKSEEGWSDHSAMHPDFARDMRVEDRATEFGHDHHQIGFNDHAAALKRMMQGGAVDYAQPVGDALEAIAGVQRRSPLMDETLIEFCLSIPIEQFCLHGEDRSLIKRMMTGRLPQDILAAPRGRQSADWHHRITADLNRYKTDIERLADDPDTARMFDIERLRTLLDTWPDHTPISKSDHPDFRLAHTGLIRAIAAGRFVHWVKGRNI